MSPGWSPCGMKTLSKCLDFIIHASKMWSEKEDQEKPLALHIFARSYSRRIDMIFQKYSTPSPLERNRWNEMTPEGKGRQPVFCLRSRSH
ncbi:hypothetical protein TNCV_2093581 [Trichonephila clavipes]|nr:hypothetical protein TNCV_2093581 [Trichonephila clavipes]